MLIILIFFLLVRLIRPDTVQFLAKTSYAPPSTPLIRPTAYDLQIQLPLSEVADPDTPLFTAHVVLQFQLTADVGLPAPFLSDSKEKGAKLYLAIEGLDHFENISLVYNGTEIPIANVVLTDTDMEVTVGQPILFSGRYTLGVGRYKGIIGSALYYRDAGEHAVFGSSLFPRRAPSVFPAVNSVSNQVPISVGIVHPKGTRALSSTAQDSFGVIDDNWQMTTFRPTTPIAPSLLAFALLPDEFSQFENTYTGIRLSVHFNRYRVRDTHAKQVLNTATQVLGLLKQLFSGPVAMPKVDIVLLADIQNSPSFGTFFLNELDYFHLDYANQIHLLAGLLARHWIGTVSDESQLCMVEDLIAYVGFKVARRMTNDDHLRLAHYVKVVWNEDVFAQGRALTLHEPVDEAQISAKCGLRGVIFLESLEALLDERHMLSSLNQMIYHPNQANVDLSSFLSTINVTSEEVGLSQVFQFWRQHSGFPALEVEKSNDSIKLKQLQDGSTVQSATGGWEKMPLWPLPLEFTEFKLPIKLMLSQGIHLAPVRDGMALANLGFTHFYRVNYDLESWKFILDMLTQNATLYTSRERAQLTYDFCHFFAANRLYEPRASQLRDEWLKMIQLKAASFPACEAIAWRCATPSHYEKLNDEKERQLRQRLFMSLRSSEEMTCGRGLVHDAVNDLCTHLFGKKCF